MNFSDKEKNDFLKAFTDLTKEAKGKGPRNIYIKYFPDEIHIVIQGVVSEYEKHLIRTFGQEAIDTLTDFYERDTCNFQRTFRDTQKNEVAFDYCELDADFGNDIFIYRMGRKRKDAE